MNRQITGLLLITVFGVCLSLSCDTTVFKRNVIGLLDRIPFCDRLHFSLFIHKGMSETDVEKLYGTPRYVFSMDSLGGMILTDNKTLAIQNVPKHKRKGTYIIGIKSYEVAPFVVTNKATVYLGGFDAIAYVFFGIDDKVEHIYVGGS